MLALLLAFYGAFRVCAWGRVVSSSMLVQGGLHFTDVTVQDNVLHVKLYNSKLVKRVVALSFSLGECHAVYLVRYDVSNKSCWFGRLALLPC